MHEKPECPETSPGVPAVCMYNNQALSATLGALMPRAVRRNGDIGHASLALHIVFILHARLLAVPVGLDGGLAHCRLVGWRALDQLHGLLQRSLLGGAILLAIIEVLRDEITAGLDLLQVGFNRFLVFGCRLQVLLCLQ